MKRFAVWSLLAIGFALAAGSVSFEVPVLTVYGDSNIGQCSKIPLTFSTSDRDVPLRIMISDDTPAGSGASIRSSVWLAAMTAAMQRNDVMNGVRIALEFSGQVDGPSAGATLCLAMLTAMDGREYPVDFAMTGTIMPDGTVGLVGGVAAKLKAAASSGIKRVCIPAFQRFELQSSGDNVDLFREGERLGIKLFPVENITEAYAILHSLPPPKIVHLDTRDICALPHATEDVLIKQYNSCLAQVDQHIKTLPKEEINAIREEKIWQDMLFPDKAIRAFQAGRLVTAADDVMANALWWQARTHNVEFLTKLHKRYPVLFKKPGIFSRKDYLQALSEMKKFVAEAVAENNIGMNASEEDADGEKTGYFPDTDGMLEISAQLEPVFAKSVFGAYFFMLEAKSHSDEDLKNADNDTLIDAFSLEIHKILLVHIKRLFPDWDVKTRPPLAVTLPQIKSNRNATKVEKLFHSAWLAANNTIDAEVFEPLGNDAKMERTVLLTKLAQMDFNFTRYWYGCNENSVIHVLLENPEKMKNPKYHTITAIHAQVELLTQACILLVKYGPELRMRYEEDEIKYENNDFLHYLIRTARYQALSNIAECKNADIPCLGAISSFEAADFQRDDEKADKIHDVLFNYWKASLTAKALIMSFKR